MFSGLQCSCLWFEKSIRHINRWWCWQKKVNERDLTDKQKSDTWCVSSSCIAVALILSGLVRQQYSRVLPLHPIYFHHCVHDLSRKTACAANLGGGERVYVWTCRLEQKQRFRAKGHPSWNNDINNETQAFLFISTMRMCEQFPIVWFLCGHRLHQLLLRWTADEAIRVASWSRSSAPVLLENSEFTLNICYCTCSRQHRMNCVELRRCMVLFLWMVLIIYCDVLCGFICRASPIVCLLPIESH